MKWQDISTAPKGDDTRILLGNYYVDDCNGYAGESRWIWITSGFVEWDGSFWADWSDELFPDNRMCGFRNPTHWMPLPNPPTNIKEVK